MGVSVNHSEAGGLPGICVLVCVCVCVGKRKGGGDKVYRRVSKQMELSEAVPVEGKVLLAVQQLLHRTLVRPLASV